MPKAVAKPEWREWKHTPNVRAWQACALSLDIDPHTMKHHPQAWMAGPRAGPFFQDGSFPDQDTKKDFELRMRVLLANLSNRAYFSAVISGIAIPGDDVVDLSEFSSWAMSVVQWDIPLALAQIAKKESKPPETPTERRNRLTKRRDELKRSGVRYTTKELAKEEGVTDRRIRQILRPPKKKTSVNRKPIGFG